MATLEGTPEYQPTVVQKATAEVGKRAPFILGRAIQFIMYWLWKGIGFIGEMFRDAIGK
jgi:hypothetical protein